MPPIMGIGAYAAVHAARIGIPWEIAIILAGSTAAVIGSGFAFAALRVKGLYLALCTLALQFVMDWIDLPRAGDQRRHPGHVAGAG